MKKTYRIKNENIAKTNQSLKVEYVENGYSYGSSDIELKHPYELSEYPSSYLLWINDRLIDAKVDKIYQLNQECDQRLEFFDSTALGSVHRYDLNQEDQINLMGLVIANIDSFFRCSSLRDDGGIEEKHNIPHTKAQLKLVYQEALTYKSQIIYQCGFLKAYVNTLDSIQDIQALKWDDYELIKQTGETK